MREEIIEKAKDRLEILDEIDRLEREGKFDVDPEKDPPTIVLKPDKVDYLKKKRKSQIKRTVANEIGRKFLEELLKNNKLIIKDVIGIFDLQSTMYSSDTIQFLRMAEEDGFVERITDEKPKSFVIAEVNKKSKIYLSPISSSTLTKRTDVDYSF